MNFLKNLSRPRIAWLAKNIRPVSFGLGAFAVIVLVIAASRSGAVKDLLVGNPERRDVEIDNSSIRGYDRNKLTWVMTAKHIWTQGNKNYFKFSELDDGRLYDDDGNVVIYRMKAKDGDANLRSRVISLYHVSATLGYRSSSTKSGLIAAEKPARSVRVDADEMHYFGTSKRTFLQGKVVIYQGDHRIVPKNGIEVDNATNTAFIKNGFTIYLDRMVITGNTMTIHMDDEMSEVPDGINGYRSSTPTDDPDLDPRENRLRKQPTYLLADKMMVSSKGGEDVVVLEGHVSVKQPDKSIVCNSLIYDRTNDVVTIEGHLEIKSKNLIWAIKPGKKIKNEDIRKTISQPITIHGEKAIFEGAAHRGRIIGNVTIDQETQTAKSQKLELDDNNGLVRLLGSVVFEKSNADTLRCDELELNVDNEEMLAKRSISTEFKLKKKSSANR